MDDVARSDRQAPRQGRRPWRLPLARALSAKPHVPKPPERIRAIDLARGVAVTLMILSHGVVGLVPLDSFPPAGLVPVHMITKFASTLFIVVFGMALAIAFLPHTESPQWPQRRLKLLLRGLVVLFWYKVLTIVEMVHLFEPDDIIAALLYQRFPVFVEILGFYAIALLWVPFVLPLWRRSPLAARLAAPVVLAVASTLLYRHFDFWGVEPLQAILVEHEDHYTWGQLARGPLVLFGLLLGELVLRWYPEPRTRAALAGVLLGSAAGLFALFALFAQPDPGEEMRLVALNVGKHPPELLFMLYSTGGALLVLSLAFFGGERMARSLALSPVVTIGSDALKAFVFHIFVIFVFFRYLLGYWHSVSYEFALTLTIVLIFATALWTRLTNWVTARS